MVIDNKSHPFPPPPPKKGQARSGRDVRLTLWHEGIVGPVAQDKDTCATYVKDMVNFVITKQFDRVYLQAQDPTTVDKYGTQKFAYSQVDFVVDNYLKPLSGPAYTDVEAGLLIVVNPLYPWTYSKSLSGGMQYNNPGYKNKIPTEPDGGTCQIPYRYCDKGKWSKDDKTSSMCFQSVHAKENPCGVEKYWCDKDKPCCLQFNTGCPNNFEQAFKYVNDINTLSRKKNGSNAKLITTIALDGEDIGLYGADKYGMAQAWQAAWTHASDINEIGVAKQGSLTTDALSSNAAFPELYWIGELQYSPPDSACKLCKATSDMWNPKNTTCQNCLTKIYQMYRNQPQCMLDAWYPYLNNGTSNPNPDLSCNPTITNQLTEKGAAIDAASLVNSPGTCPLISIEHAHSDPSLPSRGSDETVSTWAKNQKSTQPNNCIQVDYDKDGICGTFDGFGNWDWDKFLEFLELLAKKYNFKELGVYEYQFVPPQWRNTSSTTAGVF